MNYWETLPIMSNPFQCAFCYNWLRPAGFVRNISRIPLGIKWSWQRIVRGYADCDTWNFDNYLSEVIVGGLRHLANYAHSYPTVGFDSCETWQAWLRDTADMIEEGKDIEWWYESKLPYERTAEEMKRRQQVLNNGLTRLVEQFNSLWD